MAERAAMAALLARLADVRALVVGDIMLDCFVSGSVRRISPEAPIPVLRVESESAMLGGAGNVVRNLLAAGSRARLVAVVGEDAAGEEVRRLLGRANRSAFGLINDAGRHTTIKTRFIAEAQQIMRADRETTAPLPGDIRRAAHDAARTLLPDCGVLILSDYGKGVLDGGVAAELIGEARGAGKAVVVDPKGRDYGRYRHANAITPNRAELSEATGIDTSETDRVIDAAGMLIERHDLGAVVATLGKDGMIVVEADGTVTELAAEARDVFDVSGAGDTVVAIIAAGLGAGAPLPLAASLANIAASIVVGKVGTAVAYAQELTDALRHRDLSRAEAKVLGLAPALDHVETWRHQGLRIGFTNGCFDLLHPGHISLLSQARALCDKLVIGLNSDASVARLKGPSRPVQAEAARATVLASLAPVDLVVVFEEDTPLDLITALRPDVLVKGADYRRDEVVGAELVEAWGGEVRLARIESGFSTTATIARLVE